MELKNSNINNELAAENEKKVKQPPVLFKNTQGLIAKAEEMLVIK